MYRALQALDPVHESPLGVWVLSRYSDVSAALRHPGLGSDESKADPEALRTLNALGSLLSRDGGRSASGPFQEMFDRLMLYRDPPDHTRLRGLVAKAFTPTRSEALTRRVEALVDELLDDVASAGAMELMSQFAYPLPARVICEMLGIPRRDEAMILAQAPVLMARLDPGPLRTTAVVDAGDRAAEALVGYMDGLIAQRRAEPGEDLLSALIASEANGDRLSHDELIGMALLLLIAGYETTANLIGNAMVALVRQPDQLDRLRDEPALGRSAVEEFLRYDGPVQVLERVSLEPIDVAGATVPAGRVVVLCLAAANHDPSVFDEPDRLRLDRTPNPHLALGGGAHFCVGAALARNEARVAISRLVERLPGLRLASAPKWRSSFTIRGLASLPLEWS